MFKLYQFRVFKNKYFDLKSTQPEFFRTPNEFVFSTQILQLLYSNIAFKFKFEVETFVFVYKTQIYTITRFQQIIRLNHYRCVSLNEIIF